MEVGNFKSLNVPKHWRNMKNLKQLIAYIIFVLIFQNCAKINEIGYSPNLTPEAFLSSHHWIDVSIGNATFVLSQPTSTFFVYLLSFFYLYVGYQFFKDQRNQKSRLYWAWGFFLTGIAAIFAGTSYQAFGYELKCRGRELCRWTTWWEINYEILQNAGMNGFLIAYAYSNAIGRLRKILISYSILNIIIYTGCVLYGAILPYQFFISFEFLELSCLPAVLYFLISSTVLYLKHKDLPSKYQLSTWILLVIVMIAYVVSLDFGITTFLWNQGIWFSENDVLHVALILWVYYIQSTLLKVVKDQES